MPKFLPAIRWPAVAPFRGEWVLYPWDATEEAVPERPYETLAGVEFRYAPDGGNGEPLLDLANEAEARVAVASWQDPSAIPDIATLLATAGFVQVPKCGFSVGDTTLVRQVGGGQLVLSMHYKFSLTWKPGSGDWRQSRQILSSCEMARFPDMPSGALLHAAMAVVEARLARGRIDLPLGVEASQKTEGIEHGDHRTWCHRPRRTCPARPYRPSGRPSRPAGGGL